MDGTARYDARCSALFHWNVATRWSPVMPRERSPFARRATCPASSPYEVERDPSVVAVTTSESRCTVVPCWRMEPIVSW
jgi:hypothetical protein